MRDAACQLADRLQLLRLPQCFVCLLELPGPGLHPLFQRGVETPELRCQ